MAALYARAEPVIEADPMKQVEPEYKPKSSRKNPALKKRWAVDKDDKLWAPHIRAWRKTKLKLPEFCQQEGLDLAVMRKAVARHGRRARKAFREARP
jgi:hypothetical protein